MSWKEFIERQLSFFRGKTQPFPTQAEPDLKRRWRLLQVESTIACNLRCIMCPWREIAKNVENRGIMTQEIWQAIRPHLAEIQSVDFTGGGEPLLQPRLLEWIGSGFLDSGAAATDEIVEEAAIPFDRRRHGSGPAHGAGWRHAVRPSWWWQR